MADCTQANPIPSTPTRIILRLYVQDFDRNGYTWNDYPTAVEAYLAWANRPVADYADKKHSVYVEHLQGPEVGQTKFHVVIDLNSLTFSDVDMSDVHHEVYQIKRDDEGMLKVLQAKQPEVAKNIILMTRKFTDVDYPWGSHGEENAVKS